jgi:hypothetical protein
MAIHSQPTAAVMEQLGATISARPLGSFLQLSRVAMLLVRFVFDSLVG